MDTGEGRFEMFENAEGLKKLKEMYTEFGGTFQVGEILEIKGSRFEVSKIIENGLKLRLLAKGEKEDEPDL